MKTPRSGRWFRGLGWIGFACMASLLAERPSAAEPPSAADAAAMSLEYRNAARVFPEKPSPKAGSVRSGGPMIFDGGETNSSGGFNISNISTADDFVLTSGATLDSVRFWTVKIPVGSWSGSGDYGIFQDNSGLPGAMVASGSFVAVTNTPTGVLVGATYPEVEHIADFSPAPTLPAGTYWLRLTDGCLNQGVFWSDSSIASGALVTQGSPCGAVPSEIRAQGVAFQLFGPPCPPRVAIVTPDNCRFDMAAYLSADGRFGAVDILETNPNTPTVSELLEYDAVLVSSNGGHSDPAALGDNVADYFDAGGGVVVIGSHHSVCGGCGLTGRWATGGYDPLGKTGSSAGGGPTFTIGTVPVPGHPILGGLGPVSFKSYTIAPLAPGGTLIANTNLGHPLLATKTIGGHDVAALTLTPGSTVCDPTGGLDAATDADELVANALLHVARVPNCGDPCDDDATPPEILDCPGDFTTSCNTEGGYILDYDPSVDEDCPYTVEKSWDGGYPLPFGENEVTVTVTNQAGGTDSCTFTVTVIPDPKDPARIYSTASQDGWVRETDYVNMVEGPVNSKSQTIDVGDDAQNWGRRGILSFDTGVIPGDATITRAAIRLSRSGVTGNVAPLGTLHLDIAGGFSSSRACAGCCSGYFGGSSLESSDYDDSNAVLDVASSFPAPGGNGFTTFVEIDPAYFDDIDRACATQFRVRFGSESDDDNGADYISFHSGETSSASLRPELIVEFYTGSCSPCDEPSPCGGPVTVTLWSTPAEDGGLQESHWTSEVGGTANAGSTSSPIGDTASRQQLQVLLNFDTSAIPADAEITSAELRVYRASATGGWAAFGPALVGMRPPCAMPWWFGGSGALEAADFQAVAPLLPVGSLTIPSSNTYTTTLLNAAGIGAINKGGMTQMKLFYPTADDGDTASDQVQIGTGNYGSTSPGRPRLVITYNDGCGGGT